MFETEGMKKAEGFGDFRMLAYVLKFSYDARIEDIAYYAGLFKNLHEEMDVYGLESFSSVFAP